MDYLLVLNFFLIILCLLLSRKKTHTYLINSALNPIVFYAVLMSFFALDYISLYQSSYMDLFEYSLYINSDDILYSYSYFLVCFFVTLVGFYVGLGVKGGVGGVLLKSISKVDYKESQSVFYFIVFICLISVFGLFLIGGDLYSGGTTRQVFFSENKFFHISFSMLPIGFAIYCRDKDPFEAQCLFLFFLCLLIVLATNSRGNLIFLFLIYGYLINFKRFRIRAWWIGIAIPAVGGLLLWSRYYFRESWRYDSMNDFIDDKGGVYAVFFQTAEISMADVITVILRWGDEVNRYPFESFVGALMYPLPRSIFPFKPIGSGGELTSVFSPLRWEYTKSEIVTTGFGDLYLQFGYFGSLIVLFFISYFWIRVLKKVVISYPNDSIFFVPLLIWWMYVFLRSGLFNLGASIWSALLVVFLLLLIRFFRNVRY